MDEEELRAEAIKRIRTKREFWTHVVVYLTVNAGLIGAWAVTGGGSFWPGWVLFGWGIGLVLNAYAVYGPHRVTEAQLQREMQDPRRGVSAQTDHASMDMAASADERGDRERRRPHDPPPP